MGGFAESPLLQLEIRKEFNKMLKVIIPQDVGLSILKGELVISSYSIVMLKIPSQHSTLQLLTTIYNSSSNAIRRRQLLS